MSLYFAVLTGWFFLTHEVDNLEVSELENFKLEAVSRGFATFKFDGNKTNLVWNEKEEK
jgi:hypothetical protein